MKSIAIYPGTFDPITNGHMDIIGRGAKLFDKVIVAVAPTNRKKTYLTMEERLSLLNEVLKSFPKVSVMRLDGLVVNLAKEEKAGIILRGLRGVSDLDYELQLSHMNNLLNAQVETVFLPAAQEVSHISATIVREIAELGGDISAFVPEAISKYLQKKYSK